MFDPLSSLGFETEFICIDDGSIDHTHALLKSLQQHVTNLKVIQHSNNQGLGAALRSGFEQSTGDAILTLDADLTFHPKQFQVFLTEYNKGMDCVMGSPLLGKMEGVSYLRRLLSHGVNALYRILWGRPITATSSIFRLYRSDILKSLKLSSNSFDINSEILFKLIQRGAKVVEVPVKLTSRQAGVSKISMSREIKNHLKMFVKIAVWRIKMIF